MAEYTILSSDNYIEDLEELVNQYIEEGWKPQGGISISVVRDDLFTVKVTYLQAMYRK